VTLSPPDLFKVLAAAVDLGIRQRLDGVAIGPWDDRLLVRHGVWLSGDDTAIAKMISGMEQALSKKRIQFVWSVE
jgi:hypothetical protein